MNVLELVIFVMFIIEDDLEIGSIEEFSGDDGIVDVLEGPPCRIRRKPEVPSPCSCSGKIGDLATPSSSIDLAPSMENRILPAAWAFVES